MGLCVEGRKIPRTICNWGKGCGEEFLSSSGSGWGFPLLMYSGVGR